MNNSQPLKNIPRRVKLGVGMVTGLAILGVTVWLLTAQSAGMPERNDFVHLNNQREIVDTSIEAFNPLVTQYSKDYINANLEERSDEEKRQLREQALKDFRNETTVLTDHLQRMENSATTTNKSVADGVQAFKKRYQAAIDYYNQVVTNVTNIAQSVNGPCSTLSRTDFSQDSAAEDYVKQADICLRALADAKQGSDKPTVALLEDVAKIIKERRDKFAKVTSKTDLERSAANIDALLSMLSFNSDLEKAQSRYESAVKKQTSTLTDEANRANKDLKATLEKQINNTKAEE